MEPGYLPGNILWIPMPSPRPESPLAGVIAKVRASPRKLHHRGPLASIVAVSFVTYQLPANTVRIQVLDHSRRPRLHHSAVTTESDPVDLFQVSACFDGGHQS